MTNADGLTDRQRAVIEARIAELVAATPPLTPEQRERIQAAFSARDTAAEPIHRKSA